MKYCLEDYYLFRYALEHFRTVIILGETGCGKTTQLPQYLDQANWTEGGRVIACIQVN